MRPMGFWKTTLAAAVGVLVAGGLLGGCGLMLIGGLIASLGSLGSKGEPKPVADRSALLIKLSGDLPEVAGDGVGSLLGHATVTFRDHLTNLDKLIRDEHMQGVVLQVGDVGASWADLEELRAKLLAVRRAGKFVYAVSGDNGLDETGLFIASAADSIFLPPQARLELNGFAAELPFFKLTLDKLGVEPIVVRAGRYKSAVEPFTRTDASPENLEVTRAIVDGRYRLFVTALAASRKLDTARISALVNGQAMLTAAEAHAAGLIDGVRYDDEVREIIKRRLGQTDAAEAPRFVTPGDYRSAAVAGGPSGSDQIGLIYAVGNIVSGRSTSDGDPIFGGSSSVGSETLGAEFRQAREDDDVKAVVLRIDSPGGSATASEAMWREIELTRRVKPVIVSMGGVAASGGYYIAAAADTIVAEPGTITGSIGVFGLRFNQNGLLRDKLGITHTTVRAGEHADMFSAFRDPTPAEQAIVEADIDTTYRTFLRRVADGRRMTVAQVDSIAQGRVWTGEQAARIGLVDRIGGLESAIRLAVGRAKLDSTSYSVRTFDHRRGLIERLLNLDSDAPDLATRLSAPTPFDETRRLIDALRRQSGVQTRLLVVPQIR